MKIFLTNKEIQLFFQLHVDVVLKLSLNNRKSLAFLYIAEKDINTFYMYLIFLSTS